MEKQEMKEGTDQAELLRELAAGTRKVLEEARNRDLKGEALVCCTAQRNCFKSFMTALSYRTILEAHLKQSLTSYKLRA